MFEWYKLINENVMLVSLSDFVGMGSSLCTNSKPKIFFGQNLNSYKSVTLQSSRLD